PSPTPTPSATPSPTGSDSPTSGPAGFCAVTYTVTSSWNGGFTADVRVRNTGATAVNGWRLGFSFKGAEKVTGAWNATVTQSGTEVTATDAGHNATVPAGGAAGFGFQASGASAGVPPAFTLNGRTCA
ncbi:endoglucanase, partial [Streptomyces sp. PRKS01-65]